MQKFTRALKREIELEGERLAITLDADGLSVRPVGSRRPPHEMTWQSLMCTLTGQSQLADALSALKAGKSEETTSLPAPLVTAPPEELPSLLDRLERALAERRPRYQQALMPGATQEQLDSLQMTIARPLPTSLQQWLKWHNGQHVDLIGSFWGAFNLMSAEQIAAAWQDRSTRNEEGWDRGWIPLLDDYQDNFVVLDPATENVAVREVWRGRSDAPIVANSLKEWVEQFLQDLEQGKYFEDPERGEFLPISS